MSKIIIFIFKVTCSMIKMVDSFEQPMILSIIFNISIVSDVNSVSQIIILWSGF